MNTALGLLCILLFSVTVPATRVLSSEVPGEVTAVLRLGGAGVFCALVLLFFDRWAPPRRVWGALVRTAIGSVFGFSLLLSLAMHTLPASHGALGLAALPALTAAYGAIRDRTPMSGRFWFFALASTLLSFATFALEAEKRIEIGDLFMVGATLVSAFGYVEGGRLSREFGGRRVMSWAIVIASPAMLLYGWFMIDWSAQPLSRVSPLGWGAAAYLMLVSQSMGMFLWNRVLARGSIPKLSLLQLLQPFFTLGIATAFLGEHASWPAWAICALVALGIWGAYREKGLVRPRV